MARKKVSNPRYGKHAKGVEANRARRKGPMDRPAREAKRAKPIPGERRSPPGHSSGRVGRNVSANRDKTRKDRMYQMMRAEA